VDIRTLIDKDSEERSLAKQRILELIGLYALPGPEGFGVIFEGMTLSRWMPWADKYVGKKSFMMSDDRMYMIDQFADIAPKTGCAIEMGVYEGHVTALLLDKGFSEVYAVDTFEGIAGAKNSDDLFNNGDLDISGNLEEVMARIKGATVVVGFVPDVLAESKELNNVHNVSFVHLDMDVRYPTSEALHWLWPRLVTGGIIVLDDYGLWITPGIKLAVDNFPFGKKVYLPTGQMVIMK
jgi:hypothetical protein